MMYASEFRACGRENLRGKWPLAVGTGLVAALLGGVGTSGSRLNINFSDLQNLVRQYLPDFNLELFLRSDLFRMLLPALFVGGAVAVIRFLVQLVLGGAVQLGYARFNLNLADGQPPRFDDLFSQFYRFFPAFCLNFFTQLFIILWSLLLIVPGIVASYSYAMAPYILLENPDMTALEALRASKELMRGHRWQLFCLSLSFFGWSLLCAFTLGIGSLFLRPYEEATFAVFYRELSSSDRQDNASYHFDPSADYQPPQE